MPGKPHRLQFGHYRAWRHSATLARTGEGYRHIRDRRGLSHRQFNARLSLLYQHSGHKAVSARVRSSSAVTERHCTRIAPRQMEAHCKHLAPGRTCHWALRDQHPCRKHHRHFPGTHHMDRFSTDARRKHLDQRVLQKHPCQHQAPSPAAQHDLAQRAASCGWLRTSSHEPLASRHMVQRRHHTAALPHCHRHNPEYTRRSINARSSRRYAFHATVAQCPARHCAHTYHPAAHRGDERRHHQGVGERCGACA